MTSKNPTINIEAGEEILIGKTVAEVENILEKKVEFQNTEEAVFILKSYCLGFITKKLHIFLHNSTVRDYYIGIL